MRLSAILILLPRKSRRWISRCFGKIMFWRGPLWWAKWSVSYFIQKFQIDVSEAEFPLEQYPSIGDFFIRKLKSSVRPISTSTFLNPADSLLTMSGIIKNKELLQVKGHSYSLAEFLGSSSDSQRFEAGYYMTYYLCPADYHRVHSPTSGRITQVTHIPGDLWPVNEWGLAQIDNLFVKNERLIIEVITEESDSVLIVMVGATNVGSMRLLFDENLRTNVVFLRQNEKKTKSYDVPIKKGDELGYFCMGSTVVVLYSPLILEKNKLRWPTSSKKVWVNTSIENES